MIIAFAGAAAGCGDHGADQPPVLTRDSAGVSIIENRIPAWQRGEPWTVAPSPLVDIGADTTEFSQQLAFVGHVQVLSDGRIVVQNNGTFQLLVFDSTGRLDRMVGRRGQGPGEFEGMWGTYLCAEDTIAVDQAYWVTVFDPGGSFVRREEVMRMPGSTMSGIEGVSADCAKYLLLDLRETRPRPGLFSNPYTLYWARRGNPGWDTVLSFPGPELAAIPVLGRLAAAPVPFGRRPVWAIAGDEVYFGASDRPEIKVFSPSGRLLRSIIWKAPPTRVTERDRDLYAARRRDYLLRNPREAIVFLPLSQYPVPDTKPYYSGLIVDRGGYLWVRPYPASSGGVPRAAASVASSDQQPERWWVFSPAGRLLGEVAMPAGLEVKTVGDGAVIGTFTDESWVEHVHVHRLTRRGW